MNWKYLLEIKITKVKKQTEHRLNSRLEIAKEHISRLEDIYKKKSNL